MIPSELPRWCRNSRHCRKIEQGGRLEYRGVLFVWHGVMCMSVLGMTQVTLIVLKLTELADLTWFEVFVPMYISILFVLLVFLVTVACNMKSFHRKYFSGWKPKRIRWHVRKEA